MTTQPVDHDLLESLRLFIRRLNDESQSGALVVVEGKRDADALRAIGFTGRLFQLSHNERLVDLLDEAGRFRKTILLLDLDEKGRSLTKKAAVLLEEKKCVIDLFFRRRLASTTKGRIRHVEELGRFRPHFQPLT